ncbi:MAG: NUDIX hydrolase [Acidimicrobiia bacterium]
MDVIRAAGGVIVADGKVVIVHRPKYDDWSFPKGKLDEGETFEEAALREVEEETGLICVLDGFLREVEYHVESGSHKVVRFWTMHVLSGNIENREPTREVDLIEWVPVDTAPGRLSYSIDAEVLAQAVGG